MCGYGGPVYMTQPTAAIMPILLKDYVHIMVDRRGVADFYTEEDIARTMKTVVPIAEAYKSPICEHGTAQSTRRW